MIFEGHEVDKLQTFQNSNKNNIDGVFYIIEFDDNLVKIGSSTQPYTRYKQLKQNSEGYSNFKLNRIAVSRYHTNYVHNEYVLHKLYEKYRRKSSELFYLSFADTVQTIDKLDIKFENKSGDHRKRTDAFINCIKNQIFSNSNTVDVPIENGKLQKKRI